VTCDVLLYISLSPHHDTPLYLSLTFHYVIPLYLTPTPHATFYHTIGNDRELRTTHRAVLTGTVLLGAFTQAMRTPPALGGIDKGKEKEKEKDREKMKEERDTAGPVPPTPVDPIGLPAPALPSSPLPANPAPVPAPVPTPSVPTVPLEPNPPASKKDTQNTFNKHLINSSDLWGPVLVVCKGRDLKAWEEGLGTVFGGNTLGSGLGSKIPGDLNHIHVDGKDRKGVIDVKLEPSLNSDLKAHNNGNVGSSSSGNGGQSRVRFVGYYGSDADRAQIRSYFTPNEGDQIGTGPGIWGGLYSERSPCHVFLATYESFLSDIGEFSPVFWHTVVFDSPWGLISNTSRSKGSTYAGLKDEILHLRTRHRLFSCSSLRNDYIPTNINSLCSSVGAIKKEKSAVEREISERHRSKPATLPDLVECAVMLFPALQNIAQYPSESDDVISAANRESAPGKLKTLDLYLSFVLTALDIFCSHTSLSVIIR
jgi:hypothetical protein